MAGAISSSDNKTRPAKGKALDSAAEAAQAADRIRAEHAGRVDMQPGEVVGGDPDNWVYYHVPGTEPQLTRLSEKLKSRGYEPAPGLKMIGLPGGMVWRLPRAIARERLAARGAALAARQF